tara:strand:+ start:243 stop:458 length:216 start_codon:yes stop_codon:yes gene_type:complete
MLKSTLQKKVAELEAENERLRELLVDSVKSYDDTERGIIAGVCMQAVETNVANTTGYIITAQELAALKRLV